MAGLESGMTGIGAEHAKIETPVEQTRQNIRLWRRLKVDRQTGRGAHPRQQDRIEQHRKTAGTGDAHLAGIPAVGLERSAQVFLFVAPRTAKRKHRLAGGGEGKALALTRNQALAQLRLEFAQMLRDARLGHVQPFRRAGEMLGLAKRGEGVEQGGVQHERANVLL